RRLRTARRWKQHSMVYWRRKMRYTASRSLSHTWKSVRLLMELSPSATFILARWWDHHQDSPGRNQYCELKILAGCGWWYLCRSCTLRECGKDKWWHSRFRRIRDGSFMR